MTPQVGTVECFIPPDRPHKRQTVHNRKVLDLSLQQDLLCGCTLHPTSNVLEVRGEKTEKLNRTNFTVTDLLVDISLLEVDTLMCRSICRPSILV